MYRVKGKIHILITHLKYPKFLDKLAECLGEYDVDCAVMEGYERERESKLPTFHRTMLRRTRALSSFKREAAIRILLVNISVNASGTNIIEATHVIIAGT